MEGVEMRDTLHELIITLLILLLILVSFLYLLQKERFFELCKWYCSRIGAEADTGNFGLDCNCVGGAVRSSMLKR
jgi:hypothetical protein